jgi:hypothetical protein
MRGDVRKTLPLLAVLGAGLLLRLLLAYAIYPGQGFATDLQLFGGWARALAAGGPATFYAGAPSANYPPGYLYVLWALGSLSGGQVPAGLLKLPAILADVGVALLLYRLAGRWRGPRAGLLAAGLYLFVPVTWYDSALWGQVDAVAALVMVAALVLLVEGWSEPAAALAVLGVLVKPQALVCLVVVAPVLVRRHLLAAGSGPVPARWLGQQGPIRLVTSALAAGIVGTAALAPFDIARFAPPSLAAVPVLGSFAGLAGLIQSAGGQYSVLTANAYNLWALVGPQPLVASVGSWTADSLPVLGGVPAATIGTVLLGAVALLVAAGLLRRDGVLAIVVGFTVVAFAFYALPTRVHERYLFPAFASGAVLASVALIGVAGYAVTGLLNAVNLHAVLAAPLGFAGGGPGRGPGPSGGGLRVPGGGFRGPVGGSGFDLGAVTSIHLPLADLARSPLVATAVALGQTAAMAGLVVAWLLVMNGAGEPPSSPAHSKEVSV